MSRFISELLSATEPMFSLALNQLETISGRPGVDVRLTAEIIGSVQLKTKEMGLDPKDTTGKELYFALLNRLKHDDDHLARVLGTNNIDDVNLKIPLIKQAADNAKTPRNCWVLKKSVAKKFLKQLPPPNIMHHLNYKSIDSLLKSENIFEIFGALRFVESEEWLNRFNRNYQSIKPSDFESRPIEIVVMPADRWANLAVNFINKKKHNITHLKELGVIIILPPLQNQSAVFTTLELALLLHYINEIRLYSVYFKMQQVKADFATIVSNTLNADDAVPAIMAGQKIHWRIIQRYFGKLKDEYHPEIFEPHVQPEDLHWRKAEATLYEIDDRYGWWRDLDYVGVMHQARPVSLNLMDVAISCNNGLDYQDRLYFHFRESLWNELFERYMGEKTIENQILRQLSTNLIDPETIKASLYRKDF